MEGHKNFELSMERVITFLDHMRGGLRFFFSFLQKKKAPESLLFL